MLSVGAFVLHGWILVVVILTAWPAEPKVLTFLPLEKKLTRPGLEPAWPLTSSVTPAILG